MRHRDSEVALDNGLTVALRSWGPSDAPPWLAFHGWLDNVASFGGLAPLLDDVRLVAVDLPGHGQSDWKPASAEYHYVDWVATAWDVAAALDWDRFSVLGHSMGAGIAGLFAGTFPDRVEHLVMLEGLGPYTTPASEAVDNLRRAIEARRRLFARTPRTMPDLSAAIERKLAALPYLTRDAAEALVRRGTRPADGGGVAFSHDPRLAARSLLRFTEEQVIETFRNVTCPTLVVNARDGLTYPPGAGDSTTRFEALGTASVVELDGHHHFHLVDPGPVARAISDWLRQTRSAPEVER